MSQGTIITNAGPLIALGKLNHLSLLAELYGEVLIPFAVFQEVVTRGLARGERDAKTVHRFLENVGWQPVDVPPAALHETAITSVLDPGETAVLALARSSREPLVLMDDEAAREEARRLGLRVRGTLGVLTQAFRTRILSLQDVELLFREIAERPDIWISEELCQRVLTGLRAEAG